LIFAAKARHLTRTRLCAAAGLFFLLRLIGPTAAAEDFAAIFGARYAEAEKFLAQNSWISESLRLPPIEAKIALAVVFPEIVRFRALEDEIQVRALKVLYVQYGRSYANFSVGHFQMKPTFAEQLERDYNRLYSAEGKAAVGLAAFPAGDSPELRKERVLRLDDLKGQAQYLRLFMLVMRKKYGALPFRDDQEKLRFFATAYNAGYTQGETGIRKLMGIRRFHVELLFAKTRYNYADVAVFYFNRATAPARES
jgi:hypothetical protein